MGEGTSRWETEAPGLLKNEMGKKIATDQAQVSRFRGLSRVTRPSRDQLTTARQAAEDLIRPIRESLANPEDASTPDNSLRSSIEQLATDATQARDSYRQSTNAVLGISPRSRTTPPLQRPLRRHSRLSTRSKTPRESPPWTPRSRRVKTRQQRKSSGKVKLAEAEAEANASRIRDEAAKKKQAAELAAAQTVEEMAATQKDGEQKLAWLKDLQEQKRQGDLKAGSVWKGSLLSGGGTTFEGTMKIESRVKDEIKGSLVYQTPGGGERGQFTFKGKVTGTL